MSISDAVVIEQGEILCSLGQLQETVSDIFENQSAIIPGPCFGVPVSYAPFKNHAWRGLATAARALRNAIDAADLDKNETVFIFCAAKGDLTPLEDSFTLKNNPIDFSPLLFSQASHVKTVLGIADCRSIVVSNACASGAIGVQIAREMLMDGTCKNAVLFGFDGVSRFVATGFNSLSALSKTSAKPFDALRDGLTLGDGACVAVLSYREPFEDDIVVMGAASSNDANHRTGPSRTGEGLYRAAASALHDAMMAPHAIGAVKCHGTATSYNDAMEAKAIASLFGKEIPPCFSIKGAIGHTSGAGSLLEIMVAAECLRRRKVPPTCGFETLGVDEQLPIYAAAQTLDRQSMLCLSAGFGGINAAVVLAEHAL